MKHKFDCAVLKRMASGRNWLCLRIENSAMARQESMAMKPGKVYVADIAPYRDKRSLKANAYCWELLTKLAPVLGMKKIDIYKTYIPDVGGAVRIVDIPDENVRAQYAELWSKQGAGWITEEVGDELFCYYGSSTFDTKQMGRLIDLIVADCKENDIETLPPEKLRVMLERWEPEGRE